MIIEYDVDKINGFLRDFYNTTGITVSIWDNEMNQLSFKPDIMPEYCRLIRSSQLGIKLCLNSDHTVCAMCSKNFRPETHRCHAGLSDTAIPLIFNNQLFGYMMFGQIKGKNFDALTYNDISKLSEKLSISFDKLYLAYNDLKCLEPERINSITNILSSAISYLFDSGSIKYTDHELISVIDNWINENISIPIYVDKLCSEFGIGKNKLYSLFKKYFGTTIRKYILDKRMKAAEKLLRNSSIKISEACVKVGIPDYNYFTKLFKKYYGFTPRDFRNLAKIGTEKHR